MAVWRIFKLTVLFDLATRAVAATAKPTSNDRTVLLSLARTLSTSLQKSMNETGQRLETLTANQSNLSFALELQSSRLLGVDTRMEEVSQRMDQLENITRKLDDRRALDETIWKFNTLVCNASIETVRRDMEARLAELEEAKRHEESKPASARGNASELTDNSDNLFKQLDDALRDYEYYEETTTSKPIGETVKFTDPVTTLVNETNRLMEELNAKYQASSNEVSLAVKEMEKVKAKMLDKKLEAQIKADMKAMESRLTFQLNSLEADVLAGDEAIRKELNMKVEDIGLLKQVTKSRLSVYEARIDALEHLVLNISAENTLNLLSLPSTSSQGSITTTTTTAIPDTAPWDLFSMTEELDSLASRIMQNKPVIPSRKVTSPPPEDYDESDYDPGIFRKRSADRPAKTCDCFLIQARLNQLEKEFHTLLGEVAAQMTGMQGSMTEMLHRFHTVEPRGRSAGSATTTTISEPYQMVESRGNRSGDGPRGGANVSRKYEGAFKDVL